MTQHVGHEVYPDSHHDSSANAVFGFWVYLMTDFILFATFFAAYAVLKSGTAAGPTAQELFRLPYTLLETLVLLSSSFTCALATLALARNHKKHLFYGYAVTFLLGCLFLAMVGGELLSFLRQGYSWKTSAFLSAYFTLISVHGLHIAMGLLFIPLLLLQVMRRGLIPVTIRRLTCLKLFWFFSYMVWVFMFTFIYLVG